MEKAAMRLLAKKVSLNNQLSLNSKFYLDGILIKLLSKNNNRVLESLRNLAEDFPVDLQEFYQQDCLETRNLSKNEYHYLSAKFLQK